MVGSLNSFSLSFSSVLRDATAILLHELRTNIVIAGLLIAQESSSMRLNFFKFIPRHPPGTSETSNASLLTFSQQTPLS